MNTFAVGELVRVLDDIETVKRLQSGHGEWTDSMASVCSNKHGMKNVHEIHTITEIKHVHSKREYQMGSYHTKP